MTVEKEQAIEKEKQTKQAHKVNIADMYQTEDIGYMASIIYRQNIVVSTLHDKLKEELENIKVLKEVIADLKQTKEG